MAHADFHEELELRRKKYREHFSNYENAVNLICSLEAWFDYRWGQEGKEHKGLLESFNRFPDADWLTPDFEVRFSTPYIIWGDHKRTIQPPDRGRNDVEQIIKYAARHPAAVIRPSAEITDGQAEISAQAIKPNYDVVVLVNTENDDVAAEAINLARNERMNQFNEKGEPLPELAPIVVLGCHLDRESINGEWYKIKWRNHHGNCTFSRPNVSSKFDMADLNTVFTAGTHHAIPVNRPALDRTGRNPFINDSPPPIYTAIRLVIPAINSLLSVEERDRLQSTGSVEKTVTKPDLIGAEFVNTLNPRPQGLGGWLEAGLDFLATELSCAKKTPNTDPPQYIVTIDNKLIKGDLQELFSARAADKAARASAQVPGRRRSKGDDQNQLKLFGN